MCAAEYYPPHTAWRASHVLILAVDDELAMTTCRRQADGDGAASYSAECVKAFFCELRPNGGLRSSRRRTREASRILAYREGMREARPRGIICAMENNGLP